MPLTRSLFSDKGTGSLQMAKEPPRGDTVRGLCDKFFLLRLDLLQLCEAGEGVDFGQLGLALDQRQDVVDEGLLHAVALGVDPLTGDLLLGVGHLGEGEELGLAEVAAIHGPPLEAHHLVGDAVDGVLHGGLAGHEGLLDIGLGGQVGAAALEEGELDAPDLGAGLLLHHGGEMGREAA